MTRAAVPCGLNTLPVRDHEPYQLRRACFPMCAIRKDAR